ncbi:MAG TPA: MFS transporter [Friedmanniella sp.]
MPPTATASRARWLLVTMYGLFGVMTASWLARIPTVRDMLHLSTGEIGAFLLVGSVGSLAAVTLSGVVVQRLGNRRTLLAATGVLAVGYTLMGVGPALGSGLLLATGILLNGIAVSLANVVFNVETARIERAMGRTVIPQFHAAFSLGAMAGSALGAVASRVGVPLVVQMPAVVALAIGCRLAALSGALLPPVDDEVPAPAAATAPRRRAVAVVLDPWRERRTLLIGVVVLAAALSEGSANNWLSLAVVDGFHAPEASGGLVLGLFVGSMTAVRALGTRLIDRFGRVAVLRASGAASLVGLLTFGFAPRLPVAAVGVAVWGFGAALAVPIGIAAASDDPRRAAGRVAAVSVFSSVASITAPPLLGLAAESMGARRALLLVTIAMVASVSVAGQVRRPRVASDGAARADQTTALPAADAALPAPDAPIVRAPSVSSLPAPAAAATLVGNHSR